MDEQEPKEPPDNLFRIFLWGILIILGLYGSGMFLVVAFGDSVLATKMLNLFAGMFGGVLGLGSGYLIGRNNQK